MMKKCVQIVEYTAVWTHFLVIEKYFTSGIFY